MPNGGYVAAHFISAALQHVAEHGHTNAISAHWDFLGRSNPGKGILVVEEAKIARNMSILYMTLYQEGQLSEAPWVAADAKRVISGSVTCKNMAAETGPTLHGGWELDYPPPAADLVLMDRGEDPNWQPIPLELQKLLVPTRHWHIWEEKRGFTKAAYRDFWLRYGSKDSIKNLDLPYLADITPPLSLRGLQQQALPPGAPLVAGFWYPTLNLALDYKKSLPAEGVEWLRLRTTVKMVKNGRFDCDVDVFDASGDLIVQARHMAMVVDIGRNTASRPKPKASNL